MSPSGAMLAICALASGAAAPVGGPRAAPEGQIQLQARALRRRAAPAAQPEVLVLAFDRRTKYHMLNQIFNGSMTHSFSWSVGVEESFGVRSVQLALQVVAEQKPKLALWLFPFQFGDIAHILPTLPRTFDAARRSAPGTRHGVFHWAPERCDWHNATLALIEEAYRTVDFVFQFGYQDERLSSKDPQKYMPWPLGTARFRGWQSPDLSSLKPLGKRNLFAVYRGTAGTHGTYVERLNAIPGVLMESRDKWTLTDTLDDSSRYKELLSTGQYAVSPAGHNPNCYRIQEAVESGAVPVIVPGAGSRDGESCYNNWSGLYGLPVEGGTRYSWIPAAPFQTLQSWNDFGNHVDQMRAAATDEAGENLQLWYKKWHGAFAKKLEEKVSLTLCN